MAFLDKFLSNIKRTSSYYTGIDIGSCFVKFVEAYNRSGVLHLETYGEIALGPYANLEVGEIVNRNEDVVVSALTELFKVSNLKEPSRFNIAVDSSSSLVFNVRLPAIARKNMTAAVMNESRKYVPIPLEEVYMDWWEIPVPAYLLDGYDKAGDDGDFEVLVGVIRKDDLEFYKRVVEKMGFQDYSFEISAFSAVKAVYSNEIVPIACVDIGASTITVTISHYGIVRRLNTIPGGVYQLTETIRRSFGVGFKEAEELKKSFKRGGAAVALDPARATQLDNIISAEVRRISRAVKDVIVRFERDVQVSVSKVFLYGGGSRLYGLIEGMGSELGVEIAYAKPFDRLKTMVYIQKALEQHGPDFNVSVGALLNMVENG